MERKKIINHPDWEIYWPQKVTWIGFLLGWIFVAIIIGGTILLAKIGA